MQSDTSKPKVGISSCLLGQPVRYDGAHKYSGLCVEALQACLDFVPTCPELGAGLGVPRPPIRLVGDPTAPRALRVDDPSVDVTAALQDYAALRIPQLDELCGYIFIQNSPSCGLFDVKVYDENGQAQPQGGHGLFAAALIQAHPFLPVEEEERLHDPDLRENFLTRVFAVHDWRQLCRQGLSAATLLDFHARDKYALMARDADRYGVLGRLLADAGAEDPAALGSRYFAALMQLLQHQAARRA